MYFACQFKENLSDDIESRELLFESPKKALRQQLKNYLSPNNDLNGDEIMRDCFPMINDVRFFISHSHKDEALAIKLANLIFSSCRMKSFIDSMVWDYSQELLRDIDDEFASYLRDNNWKELFSLGNCFYHEQQLSINQTNVPVGYFLLPYETLLADAAARNETFLNILKENINKQVTK